MFDFVLLNRKDSTKDYQSRDILDRVMGVIMAAGYIN